MGSRSAGVPLRARYAPANSFPFTLSCPGAFIGRAAAPVYISGVRCRSRYRWGVPPRRDAIHTCLESARGLLTDAVSSLLMVEQAKFARLKASLRLLAFRFASLQSVLTRKFLPAIGFSWLETASRAVSAGKEVD
jgi:hypothetical protein